MSDPVEPKADVEVDDRPAETVSEASDVREFKGTPGPWEWDGANSVVAGNVAIANLEGDPPDGSTNEANGRLISGSPDLLAACRLALKACQDNIAMRQYKNELVLLEAINALRPAIAKALGR